MRKVILFLILSFLTNRVWASGHGPLFGLATPTNVEGGWSIDAGFMGRKGSDSDSMFRAMVAYGITEDLQISFSAPWIFQSASLSSGRQTAMMAGTFDFETILGWRFQRKAPEVGTRRESTIYAGFIQPSPQRVGGMFGEVKKAPGFLTAIATGMASRSHYLWAGASFTHFAEEEGDRRPNVLFYSLVWGYRPQAWRKDYPHWDWRLFAELTGEKSSDLRMDGVKMLQTGGHALFLGPSTLGIYKHYAIEGGIQFPVYRNTGTTQQKEKFRYSLNFSTFF